MSCSSVLSVRRLTKSFHIYQHTWQRVAELFIRKKYYRNFVALEDISFDLAPGEALGIIGENGSGKSTLLKLIAGILIPDRGTIATSGPVTGLLELGTGFNPELSGRRNIFLNGTYLGLEKSRLAAVEDAIIEFAELGKFVDEPLKSWSSGMIMRLGFAIAIHANPNCFIIDEALAVGDTRFQQKCFAKLDLYRKNGGSVLFVSHDLNAVRLFCNRTLLLGRGKMLHLGDPETAVNEFYKVLAAKGASGDATTMGYGNGLVHFTDIHLTNAKNEPVLAVTSGESLTIHFSWEAREKIPDITFGMTIRDRMGQDMFGTNGAHLGRLATVDGPGNGSFKIAALNLQPGTYSISLSCHTGFTHLDNCFHWWDNAATIEVKEDLSYHFCGSARLDVRLDFDNEKRV